MYQFDTRNLAKITRSLKENLSFVRFYNALSLKPEQERYFFKGGVDGARLLRDGTVKMRRRKIGYYERAKRRGVSAELPYGAWTGDTLKHTTEEKGKKAARAGYMTLSHNLKRKITNFWNLKGLDKYAERAVDDWFQRVLDGRTLPKRIIAKVGF
jgi:hypothetical protein